MSDTAAPPEVLQRIQKMLNLAANNPNENEAAAALAKAQEEMVKYNLSSSQVQEARVGDGARQRLALEGGFFRFQRELWQAIAELNFCLYWHQQYLKREASTKVVSRRTGRHFKSGRGYRHSLVGRTVNVAATQAQAGYLEQVVERLTAERVRGEGGVALWGNWAVSYRRGVVHRICNMLQEKRNKVLAEEQARRDREDRASQNASTSTAVSLMVFIDKETDANLDFVYGEGYSARRAADAAEKRAQREAYTKWAKEHPEEAKQQEEERRKRTRNSRYRGGRTERDNTDYGAFWSGYDDAQNVSLDPQVDTGSRRRISNG